MHTATKDNVFLILILDGLDRVLPKSDGSKLIATKLEQATNSANAGWFPI